MDTDLERRLAEAMETLTPEPPPYRSLLDRGGSTASGAVITLLPGPTRATGSHRRYPPLLAAAAVLVLAGGVALGIGVGRQPTAHRPPGGDGTGTQPVPAVNLQPAPCKADDELYRAGRFRRASGVGTITLQTENTGRTACSITALPTVSLNSPATGTDGPGPAAGTFSPDRDVHLPATLQAGGGSLRMSATVRVSGTCRTSARGWMISATAGGFTYSMPLGVTGCSLTPLQVSISTSPRPASRHP